MLFNSLSFLVFFPIVLLLFWFIFNKNLKYQNLLILLCSYIFYAWWDWRFLSLIIFSSTTDYITGLKIYNTNILNHKKKWLLVSLFVNLGILGIFKYYNFFVESFTILMQNFGWTPNNLTLDIILPVGISFYTFQTLSYTIDIYRKSLKPTSSIISFFTYVAFFPQLVAGPIVRAKDLIPQIERKRVFNIPLFNSGLVQIFVGFFRKVVIADNLAVYVDMIYGNPALYNSNTLILATIFYAFQIYYDFSGYSDIAIGTAKLLGFEFKQNFNLPYFSKSITEFWRRWHISLSSWLKDYLYISLGGNRKGINKTYRNLMITMLIGGLWHGSSINFIIWGGIHGLALSIEKFIFSKNYFSNFPKWKTYLIPLNLITTFTIVLFSWVFFRSPDLLTAQTIILNIVKYEPTLPFISDISIFTNCCMTLLIGIIFDFYLYKKNINLEDYGLNMSIKKIILLITVLVMMIILFYSTSVNFIYFQF